MSTNILAQHKDVIERNQIILDKFIADNLNIGKITSRKLIYGIGINDADYAVTHKVYGKQVICEFYKRWRSMMQRCYSPKLQERCPTYTDCTVCDEWHSFMKFKSWMENQDYEGLHLDKDLLAVDNKVYSPEACIFVSRQVNVLLCDRGAERGKYPQGVHLHQGKFKAQVSINGKKTHLGYYRTIRDAEAAYIKGKTANIIKVALEQTSIKLMKVLIMHASYMRVNFECKQRMIGEI